MAKKRKSNVETTATPLKQNPFAALAGQLPAASPASTDEAADKAEAVESEPRGSSLRFDAKVVVRREKKGRGGKTITRIQGLPAAHREALASEMKRALGCGAALEGEDVILLGSLVDRAADWLEAAGARRISRSA